MIRKYTFQKMQIFEKIDQSSPTLRYMNFTFVCYGLLSPAAFTSQVHNV